MPNWCDCDLTITGKPDDVDAVLSALAGPETVFDFNSVIPMPPELQIEDGSITDLAFSCFKGDISRWQNYDWAKGKNAQQLCERSGKTYEEMLALGARVAENLQKYGSATWYDWCLEHWGTKWNACDATAERVNPNRVMIHFKTAWAPAEPVINALAAKFPAVHITFRFYERGMGFQGKRRFEAGICVTTADSSYSGQRGG